MLFFYYICTVFSIVSEIFLCIFLKYNVIVYPDGTEVDYDITFKDLILLTVMSFVPVINLLLFLIITGAFYVMAVEKDSYRRK